MSDAHLPGSLHYFHPVKSISSQI